ncbi:fimbrial protein [Erwinia sp. S43]|uniref:fimbrial protein n=1 Tax=unclassified Erwinia TaxID=2622719 RepID=UPI00190E112D|nr:MULTISPECIES: fimbrial protein [unclassified Erwinia]MBK0033137.1 fimbrial protein [Erwinia sp. S43]MCW1875855.1 fimbrial protein [Erwinia sp. INIA01]
MMNLLKNGTAFALAILLCNQVNAADNLKFTGTLVIPPQCTIGVDETGSQIVIAFPGRMPISKIDGVNFMQPVPYKLKCGDGTSGLDLQLTLVGSGAYGDGVIKTNLGDLGIQIYYGSGGSKTKFSLNKPIDINYNSQPEIWAVPVNKSGGTLTDGTFEATATLKAEYH